MTDPSEPLKIPETPEGLVPILEAVLFASPEPVTNQTLEKVFGEDMDKERVQAALELLKERTGSEDRGVVLEQVAGGWQFLTRHEFFPYVRRTGRAHREEKLSPATLETLSIVAYKQPVTRAEVDAIRGVASANLLRSLMDRRLVRVVGRAEVPGAPFQYGTTKRFLRHFGLRSVKDLPDPKDAARLLTEKSG